MMDDTNFDGIMAGLGDALTYVRGDASKGRIVRSPDVKAIRQATRLSQEAFAKAYCLRVGTVRDWEQGRRHPDAGSTMLLKMIAADPMGVKEIIAKV
jgi:putative transcriptional regulator